MAGKTTVVSTSATSGQTLLIEWANEQDHWLRALIGELLQSQTSLTDKQIDNFYNLLLLEKGLEEGDFEPVPKLEDKDSGPDAEQVLTLAQIKDIRNVNALASGQELTFNSRLTVIFGENAAGKSGYARILKGLAAVRTAESILSDITKPQERPQATVKYWLGPDSTDISKAQTLSWEGQTGVAPLTRMDVFDSRGVSIHVDGELSYVYTPSDLSLFPLVAESMERIKAKLETARAEVTGRTNPFTSHFNRQGPLFSKLEMLGASTNTVELEKLAAVSEEEEASLKQLELKVDALRSDNTEASLKLAIAGKDWLLQIQKCAESLNKISVPSINAAQLAVKQAQESYAQTSELAFKDEGIPGLADESWSTLMESAEGYIHEHFEDYPKSGDTCIYCRQTLSEEAILLIKKYRDYCSNAAKKTLVQNQNTLQTLTTPLTNVRAESLIEECKKKLESEVNEKQWLEKVIRAAEVTALAQKEIIQGNAISDEVLKPFVEIQTETQERIAKLETTITDLQTSGEEKRKAFDDELKKLQLLKDRLQLRGILAAVIAYVEKAKWADKANSVLGKFRSLSSGLTGISKTASEQLLNQDFGKFFEAECEALKAPKVQIDFSGKKGQAARKKSIVAKYKLSDILSEGEQKVIALADFIAESSLRRKSSPIIFDDPVNSLDYKRLKHVVNRIYDLSKTRQLIVFTHNIWFATELLERFRRDKGACSYYDIQSEGERKGLLSPATNPRTDSFSTYKTKIDELIREAKKQSSVEVKEALVKSAYDYMRGACEVVVEVDLFQEVTRRHRANVMMTKLVDIRPERLPAAIKVVNEVFDKCCDFIPAHSHSLETLNVRPKLEELEKEWADLQNARSVYTAKEKSA